MGKKKNRKKHQSNSSITSRPKISTYNGTRISTISGGNHFTTEYRNEKKEETKLTSLDDKKDNIKNGQSKREKLPKTYATVDDYLAKNGYKDSSTKEDKKKVNKKSKGKGKPKNTAPKHKLNISNSRTYPSAKQPKKSVIEAIRRKFFRSITEEYITRNNNGLLYTCIIKGLEKGKTVAMRKECKMEDIYNLIFVYKNSIKIVKAHFMKDGSIKKAKISYDIPEINIQDLTKEGKDKIVQKHLRDLCNKLQELNGTGYNIFSDKKRIAEIKLYDVKNIVEKEEN